jgi:uncharacterized protein (DUF433 family)
MYGGVEPGEVPLFPISDAARFLWVPDQVLRRWATGGPGRQPVIRIADRRDMLLSFLNLSELHVLSVLRDRHVGLKNIRRAIHWLKRQPEIGGDHPHPLLAMDLATDGISVFVNELAPAGALVNASHEGQIAMAELFEAHLHRIDRDEDTKVALRLYPFPWKARTPDAAVGQPRPIVIDPMVSFGRPVIAGTRVPTTEVADRIAAGESIADIAKDMLVDERQVEAALRYHIKAA